MKKIALIFFGIVSTFASAITIDVRLFSNATVTESVVSLRGGDYYLVLIDAKNQLADTLAFLPQKKTGTAVTITQLGKQIKISAGGNNFTSTTGFTLVTQTDTAHFIIKGKGSERIYQADLRFKIYGGSLQIVNRVPLEAYVAGVVESEGGHYAQFEYFKAQAVLARTWVLKNINKHKSEGYNVKDDETSQVYKSMAYLQYSQNIIEAVAATRDTILTDPNGNPIFGAFYSNSGGYTMNSEDYWNEKIPYLRAVEDTFSLGMSQARWEKRINKEAFIAFFAQKLGTTASNAELRQAVLTYKQNPREAYFYFGGKSFKLRLVREQFKLRSTYFDVIEEETTVLLKGRGFGHGVGMSQEGAMRMSELGYCYDEILHHYFRDTKLDAIKL